MTAEGKIKIADFGVSAEISNTINKRDSIVGTPHMMAPEMFMDTPYSFPVDIWSAGIIAY